MAILYYGFFPSNSTPTYQVLLYLLYLLWRYLLWRAGMLPGYHPYQVFRETAAKLQGMIAFGECFDAPIQKKFMGAKASKSVVQVVKADKRERKLTYDGPLAVQRMTRWVATHSLALVQDLTLTLTSTLTPTLLLTRTLTLPLNQALTLTPTRCRTSRPSPPSKRTWRAACLSSCCSCRTSTRRALARSWYVT